MAVLTEAWSVVESRNVIRFLCLVKNSPAEIHRQLVEVAYFEGRCGFGAQNWTKTEQIREMKKEHFRWEVLDHPPCSPDLIPSDFHLFRDLKKHLEGQNFRLILGSSKPSYFCLFR
ncbi:hypothetical protein TNCV_2356811 [Trichonephila clavipes]|nr:hypothetical protein TNCV_2356811 [Trichonephila clavipes]